MNWLTRMLRGDRRPIRHEGRSGYRRRLSTTPLAHTNGDGGVFVPECMNKTFTPELDPETLDPPRRLRRPVPRPLQPAPARPPGAASTSAA